MSGIEIIGLVSGIITLIDTAIEVYNAASDASGLPKSFRDAASRLPIIRESLCMAEDSLKDEPTTPDAEKALVAILQACSEKTTALEAIFEAVIPEKGANRVIRYALALKTIPKADKVETLVAGMLADLQVLAANRTLKLATKAQIEGIIKEAVKGYETEVSKQQLNSMSFSNTGAGTQVVHSGPGDQNLNLGSGPQITGDGFAGTFNFTR